MNKVCCNQLLLLKIPVVSWIIEASHTPTTYKSVWKQSAKFNIGMSRGKTVLYKERHSYFHMQTMQTVCRAVNKIKIAESRDQVIYDLT